MNPQPTPAEIHEFKKELTDTIKGVGCAGLAAVGGCLGVCGVVIFFGGCAIFVLKALKWIWNLM